MFDEDTNYKILQIKTFTYDDYERSDPPPEVSLINLQEVMVDEESRKCFLNNIVSSLAVLGKLSELEKLVSNKKPGFTEAEADEILTKKENEL